MILKRGVKLRGLTPQMLVGVMIANDAWKKVGYVYSQEDMVLTSCNDGRHSYGSLHWSGNAVDIRTKTISPDADGETRLSDVTKFVDLVRRDCGEEFDVVLEYFGEPNEHMHMEYHPKS